MSLTGGYMTRLSDEDRELAISWYQMLIEEAGASGDLNRYWWSQMKNLIDGRSLAQIERMEREKGLRAA